VRLETPCGRIELRHVNKRIERSEKVRKEKRRIHRKEGEVKMTAGRPGGDDGGEKEGKDDGQTNKVRTKTKYVIVSQD